jgi:toxin ParE1/3/4
VSNYLLDPCVEEELRDIWDYIAQDNPQAATAVVEAAFETFRILLDAPHIGTARKFRNPRLHGIRSIPVTGFPNYLVFYRVAASVLQIHHVYHGARDLNALFDEL